jgi:glycosyltransferase involved in cell wall biosynthesis
MTKKYIIFSQRCDVHYGAQIHVETHLREIADRGLENNCIFITWSKHGVLIEVCRKIGVPSISIGLFDTIRLIVCGSLPMFSLSHCVIFSHGSVAGYFTAVLKRLHRLKSHVHTLHGTPYSRIKASLVFHYFIWFFKIFERHVYGESELIFCNNRDKVDYLNLGVIARDFQVIQYYRTSPFIRTKFNVDVVCTFVFVAGFRNQKRQWDLLLFLRNNKVLLNNMVVKFIGDGPLLRRCVNFVAQNEMKNIYFSGYLQKDEMERELTEASFGILLSNYEGQPLSAIEYLSFGLPIIANDVNGLSELVEGNGILLPSRFSSSDLRHSFIAFKDLFYCRHDEYACMSRLSRRKFEVMFSKHNTIDFFFSKYFE